MIEQTTLITYIVVLIGFVFIPGPAVLLTLARAISSGSRVGVTTGLGIAVGDFIHTMMAVVGISAIIATSAFMFSLVKYLGAAYLIYLGIKAYREKVEFSDSSSTLVLKPTTAFHQAVLAEVLNPKTALFFLAFLPQFVEPKNGLVSLQLVILGTLFVFAGLISTVVVAVSAGRIGTFLRRNPKVVQWQGKVLGTIYCALGLRLAMQEK